MPNGTDITSRAPAIGVIFCIIGLAIYLFAGLLAVFWKWEPVYGIFIGNPAANVGIPCSGFGAFVIVAVLWKAFPPKAEGGQLEMKVLGLSFTGPAGPITLWIACFLSLILAVNTLKLDRPNADGSPMGEGVKAESSRGD